MLSYRSIVLGATSAILLATTFVARGELVRAGRRAAFGDPTLREVSQEWRAIAAASSHVMPGTSEDLELRTAVNGAAVDRTCHKRVQTGDSLDLEVRSPRGSLDGYYGGLFLQIHTRDEPPRDLGVKGLWIDDYDGYVAIESLSPAGFRYSITLPPGLDGQWFRWQAVVLMPDPENGLFALSDAMIFYQD